MAFSDPIVGTEVLIRNQMQSENFNIDPQSGVTGWQLKRDGTATFNQLVVGSPSFTVDSNGDAVFHSITLNAQDNETAIIIHGSDIDPELYNRKNRGLIALTTLTGTTAAYNGTSILFGKIVIPNFDGTRQYVIGGSAIHFDKQTTVTGFTRVTVLAYSKWDADATTADTNFWQEQWLSDSASASDWIINFRHPFNDTSPNGTDLHISLYFSTNVSNTAGLVCNDVTPGSRIYVEDVGEVVDYGSFNLGTGVPPVQSYTKTYGAQWSESYQEDGTSRGSFDNGDVYQGYYSGTNGNQFSMIGFPYSTIASDLAGSTITKVEVYLDNSHWYNNSGGTAVIGYHNNASAPSPATYPSSTDNITQSSFTYGQAKWVTVSNTIGNAFRDGTAKGILLGKGPSTSHTYYGFFVGANKTGEPQLRITYTK